MSKNNYHHGNLKKAIINEALKLLKLNGHHNLSFRLISRNIGVVSSAPYNHFKDKDELLQALIILGYNQLIAKVLDQKKKSDIPAEQLKLVAKAYIDFAYKEKALFNLIFGETNKDLLYFINKTVLQFEKIISEKFKNGKRVKLTEKGSAVTAWSMVHGLTEMVRNNKITDIENVLNIRLEEIFNEMTAIWGKGVTSL